MFQIIIYVTDYDTHGYVQNNLLLFHIYLNVSPYDDILFPFTCSMFQTVLYFIHSTSVLSFYIDVVLTLSILFI